MNAVALHPMANPIDVAAYPTQPAGWRWAVYATDQWHDLEHCIGAGWAPDRESAAWIAEQAAEIAARVSGLATVPVTALDHDPTVRTFTLDDPINGRLDTEGIVLS